MDEQGPNRDLTRPDSDRSGGEPLEPVTVQEAAGRLGMTTDAVRMRIRRGKLPTTELDGRRMVLLPPTNADQTRPNADATEPNGDQTGGERHGGPGGERGPDQTELVEQLRSEVAYLRQLLDAEVEARRRADHLLAGSIEERRQLAARVTALTEGGGERGTERRPNGDRTEASASDASGAAQNALGATENPELVRRPSSSKQSPWWRFWER